MEQIEYLEKLKPGEFINYLRVMPANERTALLNSSNLRNLSDNKFKLLFLNISKEEALMILNDDALFDKVMNLKSSFKNKNILNVIHDSKPEILKYILENDNMINYVYEFFTFIKYISVEKLNSLCNYIDFNKILIELFPDKESLKIYLSRKFNLGEDEFNLLCTKLNNNNLNLVKLLKVENHKEFIIFLKFGLNVKVNKNMSQITLENGVVLPYEETLYSKDKYITTLVEMLKKKSPDSELNLLIASLKLYFVFGFDNAKKILDDKFTNMTESAMLRANDFEFKDFRREFRIKNQQLFYHHEMIDKIINSHFNGEIEVFKNLLYNPTQEEIMETKREFLQLFSAYSDNELRNQIKKKICEKISEREKKYKDIHFKKLQDRDFGTTVVDASYICKLLENVDVVKVSMYDDMTKTSLQKMLLGNAKANNDCLLRLMINNCALGFEQSLPSLINSFELIENIVNKSGFSMNSLLNLIDVMKVKLYDLKPNHQDIYLSTISRLINSVEYKIDSNIDIVKEACNLHVKRKEKVYSTIPTVKGKTDYYTYEVAPFDSEYLLTAGLDGKNCFKISGLGEKFYRYCLTDPNAVIIYLIDKNGNKHICPVVRTGNAISCNGIDPEVEDSLKQKAIEALSQCFCDIIKDGYDITKDHRQNIEIGTITNLHMEDSLSSNSKNEYIPEQFIPLGVDGDFYTDYNKNGIKHYIIAQSDSYNENCYYFSDSKFYQNRAKNYEYDTTEEYDYERISLLINSIAYTSIDYLNISAQEKARRKRSFKNINVMNYKYIIGNKDWYVAIDEQYNIVANLLPYDYRAKEDYLQALKNVPLMIEKLTGDQVDRKNL